MLSAIHQPHTAAAPAKYFNKAVRWLDKESVYLFKYLIRIWQFQHKIMKKQLNLI